MGKRDVIKHCETKSHKDQSKSFQLQSRLQLTPTGSSESVKRIMAELKFAVLSVSCNIPMAFHDKLSTNQKCFS